MASPRLFLLIGLAACVDAPVAEMDLAETDAVTIASGGAADGPSWELADTLHGNTRVFGAVAEAGRRVHSIWIAGSAATPVPLTISARASDTYDVRIAVLGPMVNGARPVLAADGYSAAKRMVSVTLDAATAGEHVVVVGSYGLARETFYDLSATCENCESRVDVLATPKDFALVGQQGIASMQLGDVMQGFPGDVEVEVWSSPPMQSWNAQHVATSYASGSQVNVIVPDSVDAGDDLRLVVREAGGRVLDTGVTTRYFPGQTSLVRLDAILYGDIASLQIAGVAGFFEGQADMRLRSVTRNIQLASHTQHAARPGQVGNGFNAFDATFEPALTTAATDGELLSIGFINGNGDFSRLGCFEYCNNLSGMSSCTGGPRSCP